MNTEIQVWLYDIFNAINEIDSFFEDRPKTFTAFCQDLRTKRAVERNLEIIGEAANRIYRHQADFQLSRIRNIIATRNRIIHNYDNVSDEIIWSIVITHLPVLKEEIRVLLNE
jgi:uncharacterized protein with HEPN domain